MKHKIGDKVRIVANTSGHLLTIGQIYEIEGTIFRDSYIIDSYAVGADEFESIPIKQFLTYRSYDEGGEIICLTDTVEEAIDVLCKFRNQLEYERYERPDCTEIVFKTHYAMYKVQPIEKNVALNIEIGQ